jgi:hypothetical protein
MPALHLYGQIALLSAWVCVAGCSSVGPTHSPTTPTPAPTSAASVEPTDIAIDRMEQVLTGTIERTGLCTVLAIGDRRLPLLGADSLAVGSQVTVRGSPVAVPPACSGTGAGQALRVATVRPA